MTYGESNIKATEMDTKMNNPGLKAGVSASILEIHPGPEGQGSLTELTDKKTAPGELPEAYLRYQRKSVTWCVVILGVVAGRQLDQFDDELLGRFAVCARQRPGHEPNVGVTNLQGQLAMRVRLGRLTIELGRGCGARPEADLKRRAARVNFQHRHSSPGSPVGCSLLIARY
jgi:hypothetical protein